MSVPKANTFYAVFVTFYPLRSWMGRFTVEVIFSRREDAPEVWSQIAPDGSGVIAEGSCPDAEPPGRRAAIPLRGCRASASAERSTIWGRGESRDLILTLATVSARRPGGHE